ncbi:sugar phosphate isomerase/epimerase family protein [Tautonia sociabilis]|uniref:Sugar phosphate isomerase/epimerase n=1 Tax=Tautonia sociabilis TaxID=2080755 RepID=A0A432MM61_9BACT|nr:sugar phosphate isomerase/epimerase [Tautonia sociabilis]RUL88511.1 sugar phosphate isomerase/epimerase [Tautonia sociabilis]
MFVACSTLCFGDRPLEAALRQIAELEFHKIDLAIVEGGPHLSPSEVASDPESALHRLRTGPSLAPTALELDFGPVDPTTLRKRFEAMCRFSKLLTVAVLTIPAAPIGSPLDDEVRRLTELAAIAGREGLVLSVRTHRETVTADPAAALALCKAVPGLGVTLDPSHYVLGPYAGKNYDELFPFVQNAHFRDTGKNPGEEQVRIGQGKVDYARIVTILERHGYNRSLTVSLINRGDCPFNIEVEVRKMKLLLESLI